MVRKLHWLVVGYIFSPENPLESAENQNHFKEKQNEVCESVIFSAQINTIHGVERFVVLPLRKLKGQKPQRCMCAVICTVTNCSHYFHNEMYYFNRETLLRVPFSVFRQAALLLSCYGLGQEVQIDFLFIQQEHINLLLHYYAVNSIKSRTISSVNTIGHTASCRGFRKNQHGHIFFE